jgi:lambda family phage portal protein
MGIEFNRNVRDRREAYWFLRSNPSDGTMTFRDAFDRNLLTRVPAAEVLHVYDPGEAGQIRGLTGFGAAMVKMFHLDLYDDAEIERKKQAARLAAVITTPADQNEIMQDADLPPVGVYGPGAYIQLAPGEEIKFTEPSEVGGSYEPFQYRTLLAVASGLGIPYGELSHDLTKANYSSSRAGLVAFRIEIEAFQHAVLVFQFLRRTWNEWLAAAVLAGTVPITASTFNADKIALSRAKFITPKLPWVDPQKDAAGEKIMVDNGWKARSDVIESLGADPEETDLRIAADREREDRLGLSFPVATRTADVSARADLTDAVDNGEAQVPPGRGSDDRPESDQKPPNSLEDTEAAA